MAITNNNQRNFKELDKNTRSFQFKNSKGATPSTLVLGYWNSAMTLKMHPALPEGQRSNERVFDYESYVMAILTPETALILFKAIKANVDESMEFEPFGVHSGQSYIEVSPYPGLEGVEGAGIFLNIYNKLDEEGNPKEIICYQFNNRSYYKNFKKPGKDIGVMNLTMPSEFLMFCMFLEEGAKAMTNAIAHSIRNADKYDVQKASNNVAKMMEKLGISDVGTGKGSYGGNGGGSNFFNNIGGSKNNSGTDNFNYDVEHESMSGDRLDLD